MYRLLTCSCCLSTLYDMHMYTYHTVYTRQYITTYTPFCVMTCHTSYADPESPGPCRRQHPGSGPAGWAARWRLPAGDTSAGCRRARPWVPWHVPGHPRSGGGRPGWGSLSDGPGAVRAAGDGRERRGTDVPWAAADPCPPWRSAAVRPRPGPR